MEAEAVELDDECGGLAVGHVDDEDVLADGGAELAVAVLVGEVGECDELVAGEAAVEDGGSDGGEAGLALRGDADVVAVDVVGDDVVVDGAGVEFVAELFFEGGEEGLGGPAVAHEEVLDAGAGAVFAKLGLLLKMRTTAVTTSRALSCGMKAGMRTAMCGSVERPPPTRRV